MTTLVVGAGGGIGQAVVELALEAGESVLAVSRQPVQLSHPQLLHWCGGIDEAEIASLVNELKAYTGAIDRVVIALGVLHREEAPALAPEKRLEQVSSQQWQHSFTVNTLLPGLWVSRILPLVKGEKPCVISVLSARVGSIGDNRLGGWYSYRSSKAALNMFLKTAAIEYARRAPNVKLMAFHPGTTDTALSRPFQANVAPEKLFSPRFVAQQLHTIMQAQRADGELSYLDWQGKPIPW